jgi:hypothetical protein
MEHDIRPAAAIARVPTCAGDDALIQYSRADLSVYTYPSVAPSEFGTGSVVATAQLGTAS